MYIRIFVSQFKFLILSDQSQREEVGGMNRRRIVWRIAHRGRGEFWYATFPGSRKAGVGRIRSDHDRGPSNRRSFDLFTLVTRWRGLDWRCVGLRDRPPLHEETSGAQRVRSSRAASIRSDRVVRAVIGRQTARGGPRGAPQYS